MITVVAPGPLTLVEDLGRRGRGAWGVPRSGAADRGSLRLANRLVANEEGAAALEVTLGGLHVLFGSDHVFALAGASAPARLAGAPVGMCAPVLARAGSELVLGVPDRGLRTYLGVRGGLDVSEVLGSRSTDMLSGLGPAPVRPGEVLQVGRAAGFGPVAESAPEAMPGDGPLWVRFGPGVRRDWFDPDAEVTLAASAYTVGPDSNRVAIRLLGSPIQRARRGEYPSEGLVRGAIQVPPNGLPIIFLSDHPVTGGYPVLGVVGSAGVDRLAQLRPGDPVGFSPLRAGRSHGGR